MLYAITSKERYKTYIPGNLLGFLMGTNFAPIANAMDESNIKPLASTPTLGHKYRYQTQISNLFWRKVKENELSRIRATLFQ